MLDTIMSLAGPSLAASSAEGATAAFRDGVMPLGATYLQTRLYRKPRQPLTSASHWSAGGFVARYCRPGWTGSEAFNYICFDCNPLLDAIKGGLTRYRFSDFAPRDDRRFGDYWSAFQEADIGDALCATAYGSGRRVASLHLGFAEPDLAGAQAMAIQMAGLLLTEKLLTFGERLPPPDPVEDIGLTRRERDSMSFVAEGKTDWEIATILGVAESTARFHVDNARRKLGAVNRAHAVARYLVMAGID